MCGILGYCAQKWDPALTQVFGLQGFELQHRGQENFGCTYSNGVRFNHFKDKGLVSQVFTRERRDEFESFQPLIAIAQTRYATAGGTEAICAQPHWMTLLDGFFSNATNGDLPLLAKEIEQLKAVGTVMLTENDGEVILKKILRAAMRNGSLNLVEGIHSMMQSTPGAYSGCLMTMDELYLYRDPWGFRPLYIGKWGEVDVFASETCAFPENEMGIEREVLPGEIIVFDLKGGRKEYMFSGEKTSQKCIFEPIYFSRPDSEVFETHKEVGSFRHKLGKRLAIEWPVEKAIVIPVPDSGRFASVGYANQAGLPQKELLVRNSYIPRTFQIAGQENREDLVRRKFKVMRSLLKKYRKFVLVDDSLVRSTTMRIIIAMLLETVKAMKIDPDKVEVHVRIASPPIRACCYYGIDTPELQQLAAANHDIEEIRAYIGATSLQYLSMDGLDSVANAFGGADGFCHACFTGEYPTDFQSREINAS
jgi:amidophosphoribosyltransferase